MLVIILMLLGYMILNAIGSDYGWGFFMSCITVYFGSMFDEHTTKYWGVVILGLFLGCFYFLQYVIGCAVGIVFCMILSILFSEKEEEE